MIDEYKWAKEIPLIKKSFKGVYTDKLEEIWIWFALCKLISLQRSSEPTNFASLSKKNFRKEYFLLLLEMKDFA